MLPAFLRHQRERELRADERNIRPQLQQERDGPDVVLVGVGQHQRLDVVEAILDETQVGQDQVDARLVVAGEEHPAVDDQQPAEMLENRHVAADFADATQRGDPQASRDQRSRRFEICVHYRSTAAARMSAANASIWSGVAGTWGSRGSPTSKPCNRRPALAIVTPPNRVWAAPSGASVDVDLASSGDVARSERRQHVSQLARGEVTPYADETDRAHRQPRQVQGVVTRVVRQSGFGDDLPAAMQIALGVLDPDDVRMSRQRPNGVPFDRDARPHRNVVQQDRQRHRIGDRGEVRHQPGLRGPRVIRGDDQKSVCPFGFARLGQVHAVCGVVGSGAGDHAGAVTDSVQHRTQQRDLLVIGGRRRFTGGARQHQAVAAGVHEVCGEPRRGGGVERTVGPERRHHGGQHGAQPSRYVESAGAHDHQDYPLAFMPPWPAGSLPLPCRRPAWRSRSRRTPAGRRRRVGAGTRSPAGGFPRRPVRWPASR